MRKKKNKHVLPAPGKKQSIDCGKDAINKIEAMYNNICDTIVSIPELLDKIYSSYFDAKEQAKAMREYIHSQSVVDLMTERELINIDSALYETAEDIKLVLQDLINTKDNV